jgi:hypothetical protein
MSIRRPPIPNDPTYDRVLRQSRGGREMVYSYVPQTPGPNNQQAVLKVIQNDRLGNVTEFLYDAGNRLVNLRRFTGSCQGGHARNGDAEPAIEPGPCRRSGVLRDPVRVQRGLPGHPRDSPERQRHERVYEGDLDPAAPPRARGNLRILRHLPGTHVPAG